MSENRNTPPPPAAAPEPSLVETLRLAHDLALEARYIRPWPYDSDPQLVFVALEAALRAAAASAPDPAHRGITHSDECWQVRGHHECAIAEIERLRAASAEPSGEPRRPTDAEIDDACMWFRHDYGLLDDRQRDSLRHTAIEWLRAWIKVRDGDCPGWDSRRAPVGEPQRDEELSLIEHDEDDRAFPTYNDAKKLEREVLARANRAQVGPDALLYDAAQMIGILADELHRLRTEPTAAACLHVAGPGESPCRCVLCRVHGGHPCPACEPAAAASNGKLWSALRSTVLHVMDGWSFGDSETWTAEQQSQFADEVARTIEQEHAASLVEDNGAAFRFAAAPTVPEGVNLKEWIRELELTVARAVFGSKIDEFCTLEARADFLRSLQSGEPDGAEAALREAYAVIDELAPEWSGSSLATVLREFLPGGWRPMSSAPTDGTPILVTLEVHSGITSRTDWEQYIVWHDDECEGTVHPDAECGWDWGDFQFWRPLPPAPRTPETP